MSPLLKYPWVFFIAFTIINAFVAKQRAQQYIDQDPSLKKGYDDIFMVMVFIMNIPWVIIAIGSVTGLTKSMLDFFRPREMNPIVLAFHASIIIIWLLSIRWIYFKNGAEFLERHPGVIRKNGFGSQNGTTPAKQIKLFFALAIAGGIFGLTMMWFGHFPPGPHSLPK